MVCSHSFVFCQRPCYFSLLFLLILSTTQVIRYKAEGRPNPKSDSLSKTVNEEKATLRAQIGSRPPRCERRCSSCEHCEAIQVPTNPQVRNGNRNSSTLISDVAYARGDYSSNYKPMSWKCKCGNFIFNP
ncbi:EPIDERMAL PATTERNING FACTOR-like protein 2 [Durio zibethinus]|uniref:Epidermal patterning factor-like protein n=1 Tax=Durio zibethinus TaxID=66656 RepID=A0A6P5YJ27_DURZI|nr:EPIDERMAL PATTERNING FACTOR-like protein 2 [Durio zibethinus]